MKSTIWEYRTVLYSKQICSPGTISMFTVHSRNSGFLNKHPNKYYIVEKHSCCVERACKNYAGPYDKTRVSFFSPTLTLQNLQQNIFGTVKCDIIFSGFSLCDVRVVHFQCFQQIRFAQCFSFKYDVWIIKQIHHAFRHRRVNE